MDDGLDNAAEVSFTEIYGVEKALTGGSKGHEAAKSWRQSGKVKTATVYVVVPNNEIRYRMGFGPVIHINYGLFSGFYSKWNSAQQFILFSAE